MVFAPPKAPGPDKRYGWYRVYEDFVGHPKWRLVSRRIGASIPEVQAVVLSLFQAASKARSNGYIGGWDLEVTAVQLDMPLEKVGSVYRALTELHWLDQDVIVDWCDRNPRDANATQRQRDKRARDRAKRAFAMGTASPEQEQLLTDQEQQALERLRAMSRVTEASNEPPLPLKPVAIQGGRS